MGITSRKGRGRGREGWVLWVRCWRQVMIVTEVNCKEWEEKKAEEMEEGWKRERKIEMVVERWRGMGMQIPPVEANRPPLIKIIETFDN